MPTPHKHAAVIREYANGYPVQFRNELTSRWTDVEAPAFADGAEYRVKPDTIELKYRRYATRDWCGSMSVFCLQWDSRHDYYPENGLDFLRWIDADWITSTVELP